MKEVRMTRNEYDIIVQNVRKVRLLSRLTNDDVDAVAEACRIVEFGQGDLLMQEGDEGECAYLLLRGQVGVTRAGFDVVTREAGECIGEMALLDKDVRCATVKALRQVTAARLDRTAF